MTVHIGLLGDKGRMGQIITRLLNEKKYPEATLSAAADYGDSLEPLLAVDTMIDFSSSTAMASLAEIAIKRGRPLPVFLVGSTGWNEKQKNTLDTLAELTPVLVSSNFSTGAELLTRILKENASLFLKLGYTPVITETHHQHKKDTPSGTAKTLSSAISPSTPEVVQTHSIRAGEVIGDHVVSFYSANDKVFIGHCVQERSIFAHGALKAAIWLAQKHRAEPGLRGMISFSDYFEYLQKGCCYPNERK
ncbi:MAG: dihydrodipicolinate reductase C-terminal domain-containing protein [Candidatus Poribacteria bacterium]